MPSSSYAGTFKNIEDALRIWSSGHFKPTPGKRKDDANAPTLLILIGVPFMSLMCFTAYLIRRRFRMQLEASANHETSSNKPPRTYVV